MDKQESPKHSQEDREDRGEASLHDMQSNEGDVISEEEESRLPRRPTEEEYRQGRLFDS